MATTVLATERRKQRQKPRKRTWDELYATLADFQRENGHCDIQTKHCTDYGLLKWIPKQRREREKLTPYQRGKLEEIGFDLSTIAERNEKQWNAKYERLREFKRIYNHCNCPQTHVVDEEFEPWAYELGRWVAAQRKAHRNGKLAVGRVRKLDSIGFEYSIVPDQKWNEMYMKLRVFYQQHGHCVVRLSSKDPNADQNKLAWWVLRQRKCFANDEMPSDRKQLLDDVDFAWVYEAGDAMASINQQEWDHAFQRLVEYKEQHGDANAPRTAEIGAWLHTQKHMHSKGRLLKNREQQLESMGVTWSVDFDTRWDSCFSQLSSFQAEHGHCRIPARHEIRDWTYHVRKRHKQGKLSRERKKALDNIGFSWNLFAENWESKFDELKAFQSREGHCSVPKSESKELYKWVDTQIRRRRQGKMLVDRQRKLESIGFDWGVSGIAATGKRKREAPKEHENTVKKRKSLVDLRGLRVSVYWPDEEKFYGGIVSKQKENGDFFVIYDDGDKEWVSLDEADLHKAQEPEPAAASPEKTTSVSREESVWTP